MNKIQRQILKNQLGIMKFHLNKGVHNAITLSKSINETDELLEPTKSKEDCCEMDAKCEVEEK